MKRKILQIGDSFGVLIPRPIFELLKINPIKDQLELDVENNEIHLKKVEED